jgi:hypothetical protein
LDRTYRISQNLQNPVLQFHLHLQFLDHVGQLLVGGVVFALYVCELFAQASQFVFLAIELSGVALCQGLFFGAAFQRG